MVTHFDIGGLLSPQIPITTSRGSTPRRGIGALAAWLEDSGVADVIYSSCNPVTLARDLKQMPSYRVEAARMLDMFPHTAHAEVVVRLRRVS